MLECYYVIKHKRAVIKVTSIWYELEHSMLYLLGRNFKISALKGEALISALISVET